MDLHRVDLNLLVAFEALMSERSVTLAAERMSVGQSAMSSTLGRLRKLLDDPVLIREGRGVVATPLAESLVEPVREILTDVEHVLTRRRSFDPTRDERTFSIVITDQLATTFLHPFLAQCAFEAPKVRFRLDPSHDRYHERLARHEVDLVIVPREDFIQPSEAFPYRKLYSDRYVVAVDRDHPDVGDSITIEQLSSLPYLATSAGDRKTVAETQLDLLGVTRNVALTTSLAAAPYLLRSTPLITVMLERVAQEIADRAHLKILEPPIPGLQPITQSMIWTNRTDLDPAHQWLRQQLTDLTDRFKMPSCGDAGGPTE